MAPKIIIAICLTVFVLGAAGMIWRSVDEPKQPIVLEAEQG